MNYEKYFELLNNLNNENIKNNECCDNKFILLVDNYQYVCESCGKIYGNNDVELQLDNKKLKTINPIYSLSTIIESKTNSRSIRRLQHWNSYDYKENTLIKSFKIIKKIGKDLLESKLLEKSCLLYKNIYINKNISSRNKIKKSIYIYCILIIGNEQNIELNILEILKDNKLTINNFNNALIKLQEKKYFLHKDMEKYINITKNKYDIIINENQLINEYNYYIQKLNEKRIKINKNSLLIYIFYKISNEENINNFIKNFNISKLTINKTILKLKFI